ncbi:DUF1294 domain-containing protein [Effusibacillus dendaii]|uniref:DUF1294 domain-containing protein n=1 Tax=Effusibacillus dendaii TaxID=2743772 RepID=A0A7I8DJZ3_9BACL|nr:DUF1294 domain-containing protein [Effusibacillus dendaii]BCJ88201.1 hypothetical protein skT53_31860 [Effusibacillus dendaii]
MDHWREFLLLVWNGYALLLMGYDKRQAKHKSRRVPENRLFAIAAVGGAVGIWIGMYGFRHKTKHPSFVFGIPLLVILNLFVWVYLLRFLR